MARWAIFDLLNMFFCSIFHALSNRKKNIFVSIEMTTLCNSTFFPKTFASFINIHRIRGVSELIQNLDHSFCTKIYFFSFFHKRSSMFSIIMYTEMTKDSMTLESKSSEFCACVILNLFYLFRIFSKCSAYIFHKMQLFFAKINAQNKTISVGNGFMTS